MNLNDLTNLIDVNQRSGGLALSPDEIKDIRRTTGLTQKDLATMICGATQTVKCWEAKEKKHSRQPNKTVCLLLKVIEKLILEKKG